ncbi:hypothetical protein [Streptomyces sp. 3213.3]|uniref:hypothetical protein n=1 Tax=Streptomyces sp. 3213.3 TaxID=1855348 RepID=UPI001041DCA8|nr:hypothetical protein [Streptomyces sp. 3213.3]
MVVEGDGPFYGQSDLNWPIRRYDLLTRCEQGVGIMGLQRPSWLPSWIGMNAWTIGSGTLALILTGIPVYFQIEDRTAKATTTHYSITTPGDAENVGLCVQIIKGRGEAPQKGSVWLVVHGVTNVDYYPVRQVQPQPGEEEWSISKIQVGTSTTPAGQRYELVLWRLDQDLTDAIGHIPKDYRVFDALPAGATVVSQPTTVVRRSDTQSCDPSPSKPHAGSDTSA